jgi:hypothetical protein
MCGFSRKRELCDEFSGGFAAGLKKMQAWFTDNWEDINKSEEF